MTYTQLIVFCSRQSIADIYWVVVNSMSFERDHFSLNSHSNPMKWWKLGYVT